METKTILMLVLCIVLLLILIILGIIEKCKNDRNLKKLPITINVNGIRGKSTATRLITAILWEAGYRAVGKTTGTAARMMYWDSEEEVEVVRSPHGITISEQIKVIDKAVKCGANALVCECMAVKPEYQRVYQHDIIRANLTVITNVLEDHLDEMGPTTEQIAWAFANTIPYNGKVVIPGDDKFTEYFEKVAKERKTEVFKTNDRLISPEYLAKFDYELFPHNCAVALAAADALGIDRDIAFRGMLKAKADPGALRIYEFGDRKDGFIVANAFAANEPSSSLDIFNIVSERYPEKTADPLILMNCRPDRVDRTKQFVEGFFPLIDNATLIAIGENTAYITRTYNKGNLPNIKQYYNLDRYCVGDIIDTVSPLLPGRVIICVGNIHGVGEPTLKALLDYGNNSLIVSP